jgi:CDP-6-deoxy-D-xylo-4-hexulose-3-dehydrase
VKREDILNLVERYADSIPQEKFIPGETYITPAKQVAGGKEIRSLLESALSFHFAEGKYARKFDKDFRLWFNHEIRHTILCNSGSSASLLAISAITQPEFGSKRATKGSEIITVAAGFPTTINPIIQNGLTPVFLDVELTTLCPKVEEIEHAVNPNTRAIVLAHPLGNMFDVDALRDIADEYGIFLIEDGCDSLGGDFRGKKSGTTGDLSTISFYPAHQLSAGEGGAVLTNSPMIKKVVESLRDWGRSCWCEPGCDNTCGKRFGYQLGDLPEGYDHKYTYSRMGYNLKITDLQASILCEQLKRLDGFVEKRRYNWKRLREALDKHSRWLIMPEATPGANPSWFGFHMTVKDVAPFKRQDIINFLEKDKKIGTRLFFGGNILKQPAYKGIKHKLYSELHNTNIAMRGTFWVGVHPAIDDAQLDYMISAFDEFLTPYESSKPI